jgi:hypothetical protein
MQWTMSDKPCEALRIRWIRRQCRRRPRWSAYLWSGMVKPKLCEVESVCEGSIPVSISKRQYGMEMEGSPVPYQLGEKHIGIWCEHHWLYGI